MVKPVAVAPGFHFLNTAPSTGWWGMSENGVCPQIAHFKTDTTGYCIFRQTHFSAWFPPSVMSHNPFNLWLVAFLSNFYRIFYSKARSDALDTACFQRGQGGQLGSRVGLIPMFFIPRRCCLAGDILAMTIFGIGDTGIAYFQINPCSQAL